MKLLQKNNRKISFGSFSCFLKNKREERNPFQDTTNLQLGLKRKNINCHNENLPLSFTVGTVHWVLSNSGIVPKEI